MKRIGILLLIGSSGFAFFYYWMDIEKTVERRQESQSQFEAVTSSSVRQTETSIKNSNQEAIKNEGTVKTETLEESGSKIQRNHEKPTIKELSNKEIQELLSDPSYENIRNFVDQLQPLSELGFEEMYGCFVGKLDEQHKAKVFIKKSTLGISSESFVEIISSAGSIDLRENLGPRAGSILRRPEWAGIFLRLSKEQYWHMNLYTDYFFVSEYKNIDNDFPFTKRFYLIRTSLEECEQSIRVPKPN